MARHLFILLFFTGTVPIALSVTRKYFLVQKRRNWTDARTYCQATHTDLAVIESNDDMEQFLNETLSQQFTSSAWVGLYSNINNWHWSLGYQPVGPMRKWISGEPNNWGGHQNCAAIDSHGWNDMACDSHYYFICFDDRLTGNDSYIYIYNYTQWPDARAYCRQYHTDLASSRNEEENAVLEGLIHGTSWFGMFKDGWKWVDNTNMSVISWSQGRPNNYYGSQNCAYIYDGQAGDAECTNIMPFFCYSVVVKLQIIRLKIKSTQNLNDAGINAQILEKINQELIDYGMNKDIIVKWRVQPDGMVFHKEE